MRKKIENYKRLERKIGILEELYEREYIGSNENIVLADGFENAILGVADTVPKKIVYDYWVCLDILIKSDMDLDFDTALEWLDAFSLINQKKGKGFPIFVKTLKPKLNYAPDN
jgi:hypothetical protein